MNDRAYDYDLVIRNGLVIEPHHFHARADLAICAGRITLLGDVPGRGAQEIDAGGAMVVPGLIDFHAHAAPLCEIGIPAAAVCFPSGVTTLVDCGSAGSAAYGSQRGALLAGRLRMKAWLHSCPDGLAAGRGLENPDPRHFDRVRIAELFSQCPELIGLKIRISREITGSLGLSPLKETLSMAEELGLPVMVHSTDPPCSMAELLALLRPGDVLTHAFHGRGSTIVEDGRILAAAHAARARGVWFDLGNANVHFSFKTARAALKEGFYPDSISTDLTTRSMFKRPQVFNLLHVMSKFLNMGVGLEALLERTTSLPARFLGLVGETGTVRPGASADIAILRLESGPVAFGDDRGEILLGDRYLRSLATLRNGVVVYRDAAF